MKVSKMWFLLIALVLVVASVQPAFASSHQAPLLHASADKKIPDRYIVVFKSDASDDAVNAALDNVKKSHGAKEHFKYKDAIKGFAATMPAAAVDALRSDPSVDYIEEDQEITLETTQSGATWGLDRIDQRALPLNGTFNYTSTGSGVTAYVIDTGIYFSNTDFGGRAVRGYDAVGDGRNGLDCNGHGTHVSGTIGGAKYGVAKGVKLVAVRVLNCSGSGTTSGVIAGVNWVKSNHAANSVANMSLGGSVSTALDSAVSSAISSGVTFAIAAGNSGANACNSSPARVASAITVGATDKTDTRASWSNYGSCLDIFAPGVSITSDWYGSSSAINTISGTSMATPHVAGVAALYLSGHPGSSPATVRNALVNKSTKNVVKSAGTNSPNALLYSNY